MLIENTIKAGGTTVTVTYRIETSRPKAKGDVPKIKDRPPDPVSLELAEHHSKPPDVIGGRTTSAAAVAPREAAAVTRPVPTAPKGEPDKPVVDPNAKPVKGAGPDPTISGGGGAGNSGITIMFGPVIICSAGAISDSGGGQDPPIGVGLDEDGDD
jgi:hypothetical protein